LKGRPDSISSEDTRALVASGILGSAQNLDHSLRLSGSKNLLQGLEKANPDMTLAGWKTGREFYQKFTENPKILDADYRGASDIMTANIYGLKTKESADLFEKFLAVNKASEGPNFKSMIGSLSSEIQRLQALKSQDIEAIGYQVWRNKELRLELVERYYTKKYADKWGNIDVDKVTDRENSIRQKLYDDLKTARSYAQKRKWPAYEAREY
jgi:hypothetical protein